ncbi:MAG TPA: hypothetical protein VMH23_04580 [Bacteroidota bacterium]|nr:hypothetical protein [Bacteroidota bacterium]
MKRARLITLLLVFCSLSAPAQIKWWGIFDFEFQKGGKESRSDLNGLVNDRPQFTTRQVQLFADADITKDISLSAMIVNSPSRPFELKGIEFQLANVTFHDLAGEALSISAGKIFTPFGRFTKRQLAPDNPLIGKPLFYTFPLNISPFTGYLDSAGALIAQNTFGSRMNSMYNGGYYVGLEAFGSFVQGTLEYDVALMNAPLAPIVVDYNVDNDIAFHGRVAVHPAIWGTLGFSFATGSYMQSSPQNLPFENKIGSVSQFKQSTFGADLQLSYLYYELNAEYIANHFGAPYILALGADAGNNGLAGATSMDLNSNEFFVDLKIDAPFYPGLFLAVRYDKLISSDIQDPYRLSPTFGASKPWNPDVGRYAVGIGYKPEHAVLLKVGYETTDISVNPRPNLDVFACALVITF